MCGTVVALELADWAQTMSASQQTTGPGSLPWNNHQRSEMNPILGRYPTRRALNNYFAVIIPATYVIADLLPHNLRKLYLGGAIALEAACVSHNYAIGVRIKL
jgi:hypothetical protein